MNYWISFKIRSDTNLIDTIIYNAVSNIILKISESSIINVKEPLESSSIYNSTKARLLINIFIQFKILKIKWIFSIILNHLLFNNQRCVINQIFLKSNIETIYNVIKFLI